MGTGKGFSQERCIVNAANGGRCAQVDQGFQVFGIRPITVIECPRASTYCASGFVMLPALPVRTMFIKMDWLIVERLLKNWTKKLAEAL
jgi:hypothetical protein